jgi:hypothetical protein
MKHLILILILLFSISSTVVAGSNGIGQVKKDNNALTLDQINRLVRGEIDELKALSNVAYTYQGWRTNGGPWFNANMNWIAEQLDNMNFAEGKAASGDNYWIQKDVPSSMIWSPQYASLEILGSDGDAVEGQDYHFDFILDTFDPTSQYYPKHINHDWIMANIGTKEEMLINERCHLATNSGFTSPMDTPLEDAEKSAIIAEVVDVGTVTYNSATKKYVWSKNTDVSLKDKIIFAINSRTNAYRLAVQEGALVSLCSQINDYNNPIIDGKELYPNTVKYAGVSNTNPDGPLAFNLSPLDERYLIPLLEKAKNNGEPIKMKAMAIGGLERYSESKPLNTLITEIKGSTKPDERVVFLAHLQEPGACDNASGVGLQLEIARALKKMIDEGKLPRPERTMTFIWGAEMTMANLWRIQNPEAFKSVKAALVLDMVGEDPAKTGGIMRIEKSPDPSAKYNYGLDLLPGQTPKESSEYVRLPDTHTLWGKGAIPFDPFPGHFLNDLYFQSATLVSKDSPGFEVGSNPYEGGSDHDPFLKYSETAPDGTKINKPLPALLTWHFTDYVYHSSMDTMDKISPMEMKNVGVTTVNVGYMIANAREKESAEIMKIVTDRAVWRFDWERKNSEGSLKWAYDKALKNNTDPIAAVDKALELEVEILNAWATWYKEAVQSARQLCGPSTTEGYAKLENKHVNDIDNLLKHSVKNAENIAKQLKKAKK